MRPDRLGDLTLLRQVNLPNHGEEALLFVVALVGCTHSPTVFSPRPRSGGTVSRCVMHGVSAREFETIRHAIPSRRWVVTHYAPPNLLLDARSIASSRLKRARTTLAGSGPTSRRKSHAGRRLLPTARA